MKIRFHEIAWNSYFDWQQTDKAKIRRINMLIKEIQRNPFEGTGKPELLSGNLSGYWSRRIDEKNRLVYRVDGNELTIAQCRGHYGDH